MTKNVSVNMIEITKKDESAVVEILVEAFMEESISNYLYDFSNPDTRSLYRSLGQKKLQFFTKGGHMAITASVNGNIAGAALVFRPNKTPFFKAFAIYYSRILVMLPKMLRAVRLKRAFKLKPIMPPPKDIQKPFYTFEILGVGKKYQGLGIGKSLINHITDLVKKENKAKAIYIYTADKKNQLIYEKYGYTTVAEKTVDDITVYHLVMYI